MHSAITRLALIPATVFAIACLPPRPGRRRHRHGHPQGAKAVIVDASGKTVAELKPGAYQLQLAPGRYKARCLAPKPREQEFLSLSEPVTVNVDCG